MEMNKFNYPIEMEELIELMDRIVDVFLDTLPYPSKNAINVVEAKAVFHDNLLKSVKDLEKNIPENLMSSNQYSAMINNFLIRSTAAYITEMAKESNNFLTKHMENEMSGNPGKVKTVNLDI